MKKLMETNRTLAEIYKIKVGDRFYCNNYSTRSGHSLPDYLVITKIDGQFISAKYLNHYIGTRERVFSDIFLKDSNLNPNAEKPTWVFETA